MTPADIIHGLLALLVERCSKCGKPATRAYRYTLILAPPVLLCDDCTCESPIIGQSQPTDLPMARTIRAANLYLSKNQVH